MIDAEILIKVLSIKGIGPAIAKTLVRSLKADAKSDADLSEHLLSQALTIPRLTLDKTVIQAGFAEAEHIISKSRDLGISFLTTNPHFTPAC